MLTKTAAGVTAEKLLVKLMNGDTHEIVDVVYPDDMAAVVFITQPIGWEDYMREETQKIHQARAKNNAT
jgi:hypothetical protein